MLYAFLLDADPSGCPLEEQARRRLDLKLGHSPEQYADVTFELWNHLAPAVESRGLRDLYANIELPLTRVLARMEREGIRIDSTELLRLSHLMEGEIDQADCTVECPRHGSLFDLRTGKPLTLPAYVPVDTFPVSVEDGVIKVEVD